MSARVPLSLTTPFALLSSPIIFEKAKFLVEYFVQSLIRRSKYIILRPFVVAFSSLGLTSPVFCLVDVPHILCFIELKARYRCS